MEALEEMVVRFSAPQIEETVERISALEKVSEERTEVLDQMLALHEKIATVFSQENPRNIDVSAIEFEIELLRKKLDLNQKL